MCIGLPGQIMELVPDHPGLARVSIQGVIREINLALLGGDPPQAGEWVLIQLGLALERMTEAEATEATQILEAIGSAAEDDLYLGLEAAAAEGRDDPPSPGTSD